MFIYWGWESAISVNEETENSAVSPGKAALIATVILLLTYLLVAFAVAAHGGAEGAAEFEDDLGILAAYAADIFDSPLEKIVVLAVMASGLASTQTTILPASRTTLSMARRGAFPSLFGRVHPQYRTPYQGTILIAALAILYYVPFKFISENFLFDTITALGIMVAFYYSITGFACAWFFREEARSRPATC